MSSGELASAAGLFGRVASLVKATAAITGNAAAHRFHLPFSGGSHDPLPPFFLSTTTAVRDQ